MEIEGIQIFAGKPDFEFEAIRKLEVKCEASNALMPAPTIEEANGRLRTLAAKVGANAIIETEYRSGVSLTSWKSLKATGMAIRRISDEEPCPYCAEPIKRAAVKCRYCGSTIDRSGAEAIAPPIPSPTVPAASAAEQEPLRDNNNPAIIIGLILLGGFILMMILAAQ